MQGKLRIPIGTAAPCDQSKHGSREGAGGCCCCCYCNQLDVWSSTFKVLPPRSRIGAAISSISSDSSGGYSSIGAQQIALKTHSHTNTR